MSWVRYALLAAGLAAAAWTDWNSHKIPNRLTVPLSLTGLVLGLLSGGLSGLLYSGQGLLAGLAVGVVLWCLGTFRAGDAKLLAALGAMMGWQWLADCFCWALLTGAAAGCLLLIRRRQLLERLGRLWSYFKLLVMTRSFYPYESAGTEGELPFAPFLALGGLLACLVPLWRL